MDNEGSGILQPGTHIKPSIKSAEQVILLAEKLYGVKINKITELNAYDDKNYHLIVSEQNLTNPYIKDVWSHGYVFKVMNSLDSKDVGFVDAQNQLMLHINEKGISTPVPVKNMYGNYYSLEAFVKDNGENAYHVVRLLKYQPGMILKSVKGSSSLLLNLYYDVGIKAAVLNNYMKEFHHEAYNGRTSLWNLQNALKIKDFLFVVKDNQRVNMVLNVLEEFQNSVLKDLNKFQTGLIHGDLNEANILVNQHENCDGDQLNEYKVSAIIDYGDSHISAYILELATTITYMLLHSKNLDCGAVIVQGYHKMNPLSITDYELLPVCVSTRLCQSLVLGLYASAQDPNNRYVLYTQEVGWQFLYKITSTERDDINSIWMKHVN